MKNAGVLFFLWVLILNSATSFVLYTSFIFESDIETLLKHAQIELHNSLLFDAGISDLALIFHQGEYKQYPQLEKEFISLVRYARAHSQHSLIEDMFYKEVFSSYKNTRFGLELALLSAKTESHNSLEKSDSCSKKHRVKSDKESFKSENTIESKDKKEQGSDSTLSLYSLFSANRPRVARSKKATAKRATTPRVKKPRAKRLTKKEKAVQEQQNNNQILDLQEVGQVPLLQADQEALIISKKRASRKKEVTEAQNQEGEVVVKKRASRKKAEAANDADQSNEQPKKRASRKKRAE